MSFTQYTLLEIIDIENVKYFPMQEHILVAAHALSGVPRKEFEHFLKSINVKPPGGSHIKDYFEAYGAKFSQLSHFKALLYKLFTHPTWAQILERENFFYHLHVIITVKQQWDFFPSKHPYSKPIKEIKALMPFSNYDLNHTLSFVYSYIKTENPHWFVLKEITRFLLSKEIEKSLCSASFISTSIKSWEIQGAKIILSPRYTKKRKQHLLCTESPYLIGVDRVDWGDGSRIRSLRYNLKLELENIKNQILTLINRIEQPYQHQSSFKEQENLLKPKSERSRKTYPALFQFFESSIVDNLLLTLPLETIETLEDKFKEILDERDAIYRKLYETKTQVFKELVFSYPHNPYLPRS